MFREFVVIGIFAAVICAGVSAQAAQYGTAEEARAMLERAVEAVKADKEEALKMFNEVEGDFKDRDLYVFCANISDGIETAHPTHKGKKLTDMKDVNNFAFGKEMMSTATEGQIKEIAYMWPRPGSDKPVQKLTLFTRVSDQICAVGYYK